VKIVITGAGGLIGSHLARHLARGHEVLALKHGDLDITDREAVRSSISNLRPSLVINCATVEVDDCERDPELAKAVHVEGPRALAEAASRAGAEFIHFSTNYVFDGQEAGRSPYTVKDEPRPINVYGKAKAAGERAVLDVCPQSYLIRTSWVYGAGKKSFLSSVHRELQSGIRIRAVSDVWASTTYVADLVRRIDEILPRGRYGTYHIVNQGICSYYDFALEAGRLLGLRAGRLEELIEVTQGGEAKRLAPRPSYTPMRCLISEELDLPSMREWRCALADYIAG
jgi:dTDP-4-dehydrorhamnose reductase